MTYDDNTTRHIQCDPFEQDFERGTLARIHETRAPHGAGFGLAIILSVVFWAAIAGAIFATRVF